MVALRYEGPPRRTRRYPGPHLRIVAPAPAPARHDTLPEHSLYADTGCDLFSSCLRCPLPRCKYDGPTLTLRRLTLARRDREIALLRRRHRAPIGMLAETYGLTRRSIFRILSEQRGS